MTRTIFATVAILLAVSLSAQKTARYSWEAPGTQCNQHFTFCWYGPEDVSDPGVTAYGNRWVPQDKDEDAFNWVTSVRCIFDKKICILARNQKVIGDARQTYIDLYTIKDLSNYRVSAIGESDFPAGQECEIDTLTLNRADASVTLLSEPGPAASEKRCTDLMKPKTVLYTLEIGLPNVQLQK